MSDEMWHADDVRNAAATACAAAYEAGLRDGCALVSEMIGERVNRALQRPEGMGGPDLQEETRAYFQRMYREYLGVGILPDVRGR
jgi:hypothetical protein